MNAAIISAQRCGGLFFAGCLSNHPDIYCPREEPFKAGTKWQKLKLAHTDLLNFIYAEPFYDVVMLRLTYDQALNAQIKDYLIRNDVKIIHLVRDDMPVVTSTLLAKQEIKNGIPRHHFDNTFNDNEVLDVTSEDVIKRLKHLRRYKKLFLERFPVEFITVSYEKITTGNDNSLWTPEAIKICKYLGVKYTPLAANNRKMHKRKISSYYKNWKQIARAVKNSFPEIGIDQ